MRRASIAIALGLALGGATAFAESGVRQEQLNNKYPENMRVEDAASTSEEATTPGSQNLSHTATPMAIDEAPRERSVEIRD